jgi:DNA polymerase elongation subunit (family B)
MSDQTFKVFTPYNQCIEYTPEYIITGDTDSAYLDLHKLFDKNSDRKKVVEFSDNLAKTVNESFKLFMTRVFNTTEEQATRIRTERELVSDKSLFFVKKNYIIHHFNKDGMESDGFKTMGIATKRSDTPPILKKYLTEFFNFLMTDPGYDEIEANVANFKKQYFNAGFKEIGRPMTIKGLHVYEQKFEKYGTHKGFSYHIRAAMFYNSKCGANDIRIRSGDKIMIVYIKHPETKYIAIPLDADVLPDFLADIKIDYEAQWDTAFQKINVYLHPLGMDEEGKQNKTLAKFIQM